MQLFADATLSFSETCDPLEAANILSNDLRKIRKWETVLNPDSTK